MRYVIYVLVAAVLIAGLNFAIAGEGGSPLEKAIAKLLSSSSKQSKAMEQEIIKNSTPESMKAIDREIESNCRKGKYEEVRRLAGIKGKMQCKSGVKTEVLKPLKKNPKASAGDKITGKNAPNEFKVVGKKLQSGDK